MAHTHGVQSNAHNVMSIPLPLPLALKYDKKQFGTHLVIKGSKPSLSVADIYHVLCEESSIYQEQADYDLDYILTQVDPKENPSKISQRFYALRSRY